MNPEASITESEEDEEIDENTWKEKEAEEGSRIGEGGDEMEHPDPLHLPTLLRLSTALLGAVGKRLIMAVFGTNDIPKNEDRTQSRARRHRGEEEYDPWTVWGLAGIAFAIGFCAGLIVNVKDIAGV